MVKIKIIIQIYIFFNVAKMNKLNIPKAMFPQIPVCAVFLLTFFFSATTALANLDADEASRMTQLLTMDLDDLINMEVSIATGTAKPLKLAPAIATVITAQDIEDLGATTLTKALEIVPGLHVIPANDNRLIPLYTIRGIYTNENPQVLVMMDGTPITNGIKNTRPAGFNISTANIARIEVIRGPGSAMNGADAFAGTINIVTKKATEINGATARMRADSFGTSDTALQYGGNHLGWDMAWSLDYMRNDGDHDRVIESDLQTALDAAFGTSASIAPGPLDTDYKTWDGHLTLAKNNWTIRMWGWKRQGGEGAGAAQALDPHGEENNDLFFTDLLYRNEEMAPDWDVDLRLGYKYTMIDSFLYVFPAGTTLPIGADGNIDFVNTVGLTNFPDGAIGNPSTKEHHGTLDFSALYDGLADHLVRIGTGFHYLTMRSTTLPCRMSGPLPKTGN
jgi:iron complex outermembrane receptor protein